MTFLLLAAAAALVSEAIGSDLRIKSVDEFIEFKDNVNSGNNYSGTTVFLDSDLSLVGESFEPIGNYSKYFRGVFDGQGHVISNLAITSSSQYVGLFGYSGGLTIKNVILDSSCSITSSFSGSNYAYIGWIIGYCSANNGPCAIENSVNMGSVTFSGSVSDDSNDLDLGGIAGEIYSRYYESTVKNCANYGDVTDSGESWNSRIGGIIGDSSVSSSKRVYIYNCLNHGTITHNDTSSNNLYLGGIAGYIYCTTIENCVSAGKISSLTTASIKNYIGSIVGSVSYDTSINYTYFTSDLSGYGKYGDGTPLSEYNTLSYDSTSFKLDGAVSIGEYTGTSLIGALNAAADYYTLRDYSHWLLNKGSNAVTFTINGRANPIKMDSQIILLPSLASEGNMSFDGWYTDNELTIPLTEFEVTGDTELYGKFEENTNNYTISFDTRREGVSVASIAAPFGTVVTLPSESVGEKYMIALWETVYGDNVGLSLVMPSHNITLYAVWGCTRIKTPEDFAIFADSVNKGASYSGMTVFLESDLSFAGKSFEPIGNSYYNYFSGVFDGQGHVISNLAMTSSSQYVGLFGYSGGLTIRNIILDSSCSITSSFSGSDGANIGGIIGKCYAPNGGCTIENSVNMGSVAFRGNVSSSYLYLGGIAGYLYSYRDYESTVKNCANYGDLIHSGTSSDSYIGGIAGSSVGSSPTRVYIYNCLNHCTITHSGTSRSLRIGGIVGETYYTTIENCVSSGKISLPTTASSSNWIGSIVGGVSSDTSINYTYFTSDLSGYNKYGDGTSSEYNTLSYDSTTSFELNETVSIGTYSGTSLVDALNAAADYYALREYSHWLLNKGSNAVSFTINGRTSSIKMDYQVILLPSLASEGNMSFDGWYTDNGLTTPLTEFEVTKDTELYGGYCALITVTLDVNGGDELAVKEMIIDCDRVYGDLPTPTRTGHTFLGWFTEKNESITGGFIVETPANHTLYAHWLEVTQNQVEIVFSTKDMSKKEIEEVIRKYTDADFKITVIESITDEVRVIVEFVDFEKAESFIKTVEASSEAKTVIRNVRFIKEITPSFSPAHLAMSLLWLI